MSSLKPSKKNQNTVPKVEKFLRLDESTPSTGCNDKIEKNSNQVVFSQEMSNNIKITDEFSANSLMPETSRKTIEISDHKKHIEEIEAKMSKCMTLTDNYRDSGQAEKSNQLVRNACQSPDEADFYSIKEDEQIELENMKLRLRENIMNKERFLDIMCDEMTKASPTKKSDEFNSTKKRNLDATKKSKLLAALKAIDGNESFEK